VIIASTAADVWTGTAPQQTCHGRIAHGYLDGPWQRGRTCGGRCCERAGCQKKTPERWEGGEVFISGQLRALGFAAAIPATNIYHFPCNLNASALDVLKKSPSNISQANRWRNGENLPFGMLKNLDQLDC